MIFDVSKPVLLTLFYGFLSAVAFPIGAAIGWKMSNRVSSTVIACIIAFGAGSLMFAVTIELYAEALRDLEVHGSIGKFEIAVNMGSACVGACVFAFLNRRFASCHHEAGKKQNDSILDGERCPLTRNHQGLSSTLPLDQGGLDRDPSRSMWIGLSVDAVPEAVLLAFLVKEQQLSMSMMFSLFVANFPEAFAAACLDRRKGVSFQRCLAMWSSVCILTAVLSGLSAVLIPDELNSQTSIIIKDLVGAVVEGLAGGAMLAMIAAGMLPEAFRAAKEFGGVFFVVGFLASVSIRAVAPPILS